MYKLRLYHYESFQLRFVTHLSSRPSGQWSLWVITRTSTSDH